MSPDPSPIPKPQSPADNSCGDCQACPNKGHVFTLKPGQMEAIAKNGLAVTIAQTGHDQPPVELCVKIGTYVLLTPDGAGKRFMDPYVRSAN